MSYMIAPFGTSLANSSHTYWRLRFPHGNVGAVSDRVVISEIEMRPTVSGADQCTGGTAFASTVQATYTAAGAFDDGAGEWSSTSDNDVNSHIGYQFASAVEVREITVKVGADTNLNPRSIVLEYSDNGTSYSVAAEIPIGLSFTAGETKTFAVADYPQNLFNYVVFLAGFEGADGSTALGNSEGKVSGLAMTANGNAQIDTAQSKFGSSSILLDGSGDYVSLADNFYWSPPRSGFAVEAWIRFDAGANLAASHTIMAQYRATGNDRCFIFTYGGGGSLALQASDDGVTLATQVSGSWSPSTGVWYHVVGARSATDPATYRVFVDGVMLAKSTTGLSVDLYEAATLLTIGATNVPSNYFHGWIDEPRFINGYCPPEYDSDSSFTPPSAAFPRA